MLFGDGVALEVMGDNPGTVGCRILVHDGWCGFAAGVGRRGSFGGQVCRRDRFILRQMPRLPPCRQCGHLPRVDKYQPPGGVTGFTPWNAARRPATTRRSATAKKKR